MYEAISSEYTSGLSTVTVIIAFFLVRRDEIRITCMYFSNKPITNIDKMFLKHEKLPRSSITLLRKGTLRFNTTPQVALFW